MQNDKIDKLKKSPIFNMSLSSKELFHSNFLAWIIETYNEQMSSFFSRFCEAEEGTIQNIQREKKNVDISFTIGDTFFMIENKVKSIAYLEQLERYDTYEASDFIKSLKSSKKCTILLSLKKPKNLEKSGWKHLSYDELIIALKELKIEDPYHEALIDDYIDFVTILAEEIVAKIDIKKISISKLYLNNSDENKLLKAFSEIKMHDLFLKGLFEDLAYDWLIKLKDELGEKVEYRKNDETPQFSINHTMTRSQGLVEIKYKLDNNTTLGIQIQGEHYRHLVEGSNKDEIQRISKILLDKKEWFCFEGSEVYPKKNDFNRFSTKEYLFLYKSIKFDCSNEELYKKIKEDCFKIRTIAKHLKCFSME